MNDNYYKIMALKGADGLKSIVRKWENLSNNIKHSSAGNLNILPDMLWFSNRGINKTEILRLLSEYLSDEGNIMTLSGDVKFIEFYLGCNKAENNEFSELKRFIQTLKTAAGFRDSFKGIVYIDITEWVNDFDNKRFTAFLEYLATNTNDWLLILNIDADIKDTNDIEALLSSYLRIEKITLKIPETRHLVEDACEIIESFNFSVDDSGKSVLEKSINKLRKHQNFDGFKTVENICKDIIYNTLSKKSIRSYTLSEADLSDFGPESNYIKRMTSNEKKSNNIGFQGE